MIGQRFNKLVVLASAGKTKWNELLWLCACDCGRETTVQGKRLRAGLTRSCGCLINADGHGVTHGGRYTRLYRIWAGMRQRCSNQKAKDYQRYGGAGITVCGEWVSDFAAFQSWAVTAGYSADLSIDRIDGTRGYEPANCRWVTTAENSRNRACVKLSLEAAAEIRRLVADGVSHSSVARSFNVSRSNVSQVCEGKAWLAR